MHFKKILSASILASALIFCIPQAIYAAPDAKTETPVTYGWNSDALGRFFLTENGSRATGFCSIDQKVYYFDPDGYLFTPSQEGVMYLAQKPYYFLADGSVKTGLFSIKSESGISWYYAGANYQLFTNRTITLGGKIYCFGANGKSLPKGLQALNGKKYLIYDETIVEGGDQTHNIVKIWPDKVEVTKRGLVDTHMTFECGKKHMCNYMTPVGLIILGITTSALEVEEDETSMGIVISYALEMNGEYISGCGLEIYARDKGNGPWSLD